MNTLACNLDQKIGEKIGEKVTEKTFKALTGADVDVEKGGKVVTIKGSSGEVQRYTVGDEVEMPKGWPADFPLPAGAKLIAASELGGALMISMTASGTPKQVREFYDKHFESFDKNLCTLTGGADGGAMCTYTKDKKMRMIVANYNDGKSGKELQVHLTASETK